MDVTCPTPSEIEEAGRPFFLKALWKLRKAWILFVVALAFIVFAVLTGVHHKIIAAHLEPAADWMKARPYGWLIPVAILTLLSFPPLFGHEFVSFLVGDFYGLGIGFGIVAIGTLAGEILCYFLFKHLCFTRGQKMERRSWFYVCFASAIRDGGFKMALLSRLSSIPSHFTTAIFATCGIGFPTFIFAVTAALPKQVGTVAAGALLSGDKTARIPATVLLSLTGLATFFAQRYLEHKVSQQRLVVVRERRKAAVKGKEEV